MFIDKNTEPYVGELTGALWDLSFDMLAVISADGYFTFANSSWQKLLGYSVEELTSHPYLDFVHPEDEAETITQTKKLAKPSNTLVNFQNRYRTKDGDYRWLSWNCKTDEIGTQAYCVARDITQEMLIRQKLETLAHEAQTSERHYKMLAQNATDVVWEQNTGGKITWVSPSIELVLGWTPEQLIGTLAQGIIKTTELDSMIKIMSNLTLDEQIPLFELEILTKSGGYRWMSVIFS